MNWWEGGWMYRCIGRWLDGWLVDGEADDLLKDGFSI